MVMILTAQLTGYILESDVFNQQGMLLLPKGHILSASDVQFLNMHNIFEVDARFPEVQKNTKENILIADTQLYIRVQTAQKHYSSTLESIKRIFASVKNEEMVDTQEINSLFCLLYTSPSPRD